MPTQTCEDFEFCGDFCESTHCCHDFKDQYNDDLYTGFTIACSILK